MKTLTTLLIMILISFTSVKAQASGSTPVQINPAGQGTPGQTAVQAQHPEWNNPVWTGSNPPSPRRNNGVLVQAKRTNDYRVDKNLPLPKKELYRKSTNVEKVSIQPEQADLVKFAEFLKQPDTGLLKLTENKGCSSTTVIDASADCLKYTMPGGGSSYSFRYLDYRIQELSDVSFTGGKFVCLGSWTQGIFAVVGDISLDKINLQTPGTRFLADYKPETSGKKFLEKQINFVKGVESDGYIYRNNWNVIENTTYILRSIAYGAKFFSGMHFDWDDFDKKRDIIVAFRIVRKGDDGSITILWKKLSNTKSPRIY